MGGRRLSYMHAWREEVAAAAVSEREMRDGRVVSPTMHFIQDLRARRSNSISSASMLMTL